MQQPTTPSIKPQNLNNKLSFNFCPIKDGLTLAFGAIEIIVAAMLNSEEVMMNE